MEEYQLTEKGRQTAEAILQDFAAGVDLEECASRQGLSVDEARVLVACYSLTP